LVLISFKRASACGCAAVCLFENANAGRSGSGLTRGYNILYEEEQKTTLAQNKIGMHA